MFPFSCDVSFPAARLLHHVLRFLMQSLPEVDDAIITSFDNPALPHVAHLPDYFPIALSSPAFILGIGCHRCPSVSIVRGLGKLPRRTRPDKALRASRLVQSADSCDDFAVYPLLFPLFNASSPLSQLVPCPKHGGKLFIMPYALCLTIQSPIRGTCY